MSSSLFFQELRSAEETARRLSPLSAITRHIDLLPASRGCSARYSVRWRSLLCSCSTGSKSSLYGLISSPKFPGGSASLRRKERKRKTITSLLGSKAQDFFAWWVGDQACASWAFRSRARRMFEAWWRKGKHLRNVRLSFRRYRILFCPLAGSAGVKGTLRLCWVLRPG